MKSRQTQYDMLLAHLRSYNAEKGEYRSISAMEALGLYRIRSLSSRISRLKALGYKIQSTRKIDPTGVPYVRYRMVFKDQRQKRSLTNF